jgi:hypothetical protein
VADCRHRTREILGPKTHGLYRSSDEAEKTEHTIDREVRVAIGVIGAGEGDGSGTSRVPPEEV